MKMRKKLLQGNTSEITKAREKSDYKSQQALKRHFLWYKMYACKCLHNKNDDGGDDSDDDDD